MRDIFTVIKFTMRDILSRKSFRISTILIVVFISKKIAKNPHLCYDGDIKVETAHKVVDLRSA